MNQDQDLDQDQPPLVAALQAELAAAGLRQPRRRFVQRIARAATRDLASSAPGAARNSAAPTVALPDAVRLAVRVCEQFDQPDPAPQEPDAGGRSTSALFGRLRRRAATVRRHR